MVRVRHGFCARKPWMSRLGLFGLEIWRWRKLTCVSGRTGEERVTRMVTECTRTVPRVSQLKTAGGWGSAQGSVIQPSGAPRPGPAHLLPIPWSRARNKACFPTSLDIIKAITSTITSSADKRLDPLSMCAAGHREPLCPWIAITVTAELFLAISPQRMRSICISLSSRRLFTQLGGI